MARRKAVGPGTGGDRFEALNDRRSSGIKRGLAFNPNDRQAGLPDTLMAHAFMKALVRWAARRPEPSTKITIPSGIAPQRTRSRLVGAQAERAVILKIFEDGRLSRNHSRRADGETDHRRGIGARVDHERHHRSENHQFRREIQKFKTGSRTQTMEDKPAT
jgi:hypothetical protein